MNKNSKRESREKQQRQETDTGSERAETTRTQRPDTTTASEKGTERTITETRDKSSRRESRDKKHRHQKQAQQARKQTQQAQRPYTQPLLYEFWQGSLTGSRVGFKQKFRTPCLIRIRWGLKCKRVYSLPQSTQMSLNHRTLK